jgi:hypothetical protein
MWKVTLGSIVRELVVLGMRDAAALGCDVTFVPVQKSNF